MNLAVIIIAALLALGAAVNSGGAGVPAAATGTSSATIQAAMPTPSPTPAPAAYDIISGGGPTH